MRDFSAEKEIVVRRFSFLSSLGYQLTNVRVRQKGKEDKSDGLEFCYISNSAKRKIEISFNVQEKLSLHVLIENLNKDRGQTNQISRVFMDSFLLLFWGKKYGVEKTGYDFLVQRQGESTTEFVDRYGARFEELCKNELNGILLGKSWDNVEIDPTDLG